MHNATERSTGMIFTSPHLILEHKDGIAGSSQEKITPQARQKGSKLLVRSSWCFLHQLIKVIRADEGKQNMDPSSVPGIRSDV